MEVEYIDFMFQREISEFVKNKHLRLKVFNICCSIAFESCKKLQKPKSYIHSKNLDDLEVAKFDYHIAQ
jgi:hypothetical protein